MTLYVITGPPCGGKSTYVRERARPGDFVVDLDRLALAITSEDTPHHEYPAHIRSAAIIIRKQAVALALVAARTYDAYVIHAKPTATARATYKRNRAVFVHQSAPLPVLLARAMAERPEWVLPMIRSWFDEPMDEPDS
jgi:predicted kinase